MLDDVLTALADGGVRDILVLAADASAEALAGARGVAVLRDPDERTGAAADRDGRLRAAVDAGLATIAPEGARLVVAADLPRLTAAEVATIVADPSEVVVAPTVGGGTAVLRLAPDVVIPARYGPGSAGAHLRAAEDRGFTTSVVDLPGARHDIDAAADLAALTDPLDGATPGPATSALLRGHDGYAR